MFIDLLRKRRSIRNFKSTPIDKESLDLLVEALLRSPSSRSRNPWHFVVVQQPETLARLAAAKPHGASFIGRAPLAIAICGDPDRCDVWVEDCSIAAHNLHLTASDLGLGSCWAQIRLRDHDQETKAEAYVRKILGIGQEISVLAIVAIGYPDEEKAGHPQDSLDYDKISFEKYSGPEA